MEPVTKSISPGTAFDFFVYHRRPLTLGQNLSERVPQYLNKETRFRLPPEDVPDRVRKCLDQITWEQIHNAQSLGLGESVHSDSFSFDVVDQERGIIRFSERAMPRLLEKVLGVRRLADGWLEARASLNGETHESIKTKMLQFFAASTRAGVWVHKKVFRRAEIRAFGLIIGPIFPELVIGLTPVAGVKIVLRLGDSSSSPSFKTGYGMIEKGGSVFVDSSHLSRDRSPIGLLEQPVMVTAELTRQEDRDSVTGYALLESGVRAFLDQWEPFGVAFRAMQTNPPCPDLEPNPHDTPENLETKTLYRELARHEYLDIQVDPSCPLSGEDLAPFSLDTEGRYLRFIRSR